MAKIAKSVVDADLRARIFNWVFDEEKEIEISNSIQKVNDRQFGAILTDKNGVKRYCRIGVIVAEEREDMTAEELMEKEIDMKELCEHIVPLKEEDNNFQLPMADLNPNTAVKEGDDDADNTDEEKKTDDAAEKKDDSEKVRFAVQKNKEVKPSEE